MHLRIKSAEHAEMGWAAKLMSSGFKLTWRPERFGRTQYLLKQGGDHLVFTQDPHRVAKTDMRQASPGQIRLAHALVENGIGRLVPKP